MDFIYTRVSSDLQTVESQSVALKAKYPDAALVSETASGAKKRPILKALLAELQPGDRLIVAALDRIARNAWELHGVARDLEARGVTLISAREAMDFSTITGKMVLGVLASVAELELNLIRERTKAGLAAARAAGRSGGRPVRISPEIVQRGISAYLTGKSIRAAAADAGISDVYLRQKLKAQGLLRS